MLFSVHHIGRHTMSICLETGWLSGHVAKFSTLKSPFFPLQFSSITYDVNILFLIWPLPTSCSLHWWLPTESNIMEVAKWWFSMSVIPSSLIWHYTSKSFSFSPLCFFCLFVYYLFISVWTYRLLFCSMGVSLTIINHFDAGIVPELASGLIPVSFLCVPITLWASLHSLAQNML